MASRFTTALLLLLFFAGAAGCVPTRAAEPPPQDDTCLACHGEKEMKSERGQSIYVDAAKHKGSVHGGLSCLTCHAGAAEFPHPPRMTKPTCATCHSQAAVDLPKSTHAALGPQSCVACHGQPHEVQRAKKTATEACASCHAEDVREYRLSVHREAYQHGDIDAATCQSCHGPAHKTLSHRDPASPVAKRNLPDTCGACHANPEFLARHKIAFAKPVEAYRLSTHGRMLHEGNEAVASCSDCHANHAIFMARDLRSKINHWKVAETCGACHAEIQQTYIDSVHGTAVKRGVRASPTCTDCHGEHTILAPSEPQSLVNPARVSSVTCGRCHADERIAARYNLPLDKVPAFADSYHGLALRSGSQTFANCASCHGVHNILPSSDPRSTVHPTNLAKTCGTCHPGAGQRFAIGAVHVRPATASEHIVVKWIRVGYLILIPASVAFMLLHNLLDLIAKMLRGGPRFHSGEHVVRMNLHFRIAHWLTVLSFPTLVVTGFALTFPETWWAAPILRWEAELGLRGILHRTAAVVLLLSLTYHVVHLIASKRDRIILRAMMPQMQDATDLVNMFRYNLGMTDERPRFGMFSYAEKFEYLAFMWGTVVMAISGFILWFNNFSLRYLPKWVTDAATALHFYEAVLASLAILIWHFYMTVFDPDVYPMDLAWLTGKASADHLKHTRPEYYLQLVAKPAPADAAAESKANTTNEASGAGTAGTAEPPNPEPDVPN
jgi:formate dehydrogenase gamma subunit